MCVLVILGTTRTAVAQEAGANRYSIRPIIGVGGSVLEFDVGDDAWRGYLGRAGAGIGGIATVSLAGQVWPKLAYDGHGSSLLLEVSYFPFGRLPVAPYTSFGLGHFSWTLPGEGSPVITGTAKAFALGFQVWPLSAWGVDVAGLLRRDADAGDDELRVSLIYGPPDARWRRGAGIQNPATFEIAYLAPISGPWHFVEPGYFVSFSQRVKGPHAATLGVGLVHWQIPYPGGGWEWDTRAVFLMPAWRWVGSPLAASRPYVTAGPLMSGMIEGPDDGFRGGFHAGVGYDLGLPAVALSGGASFLWLTRADSRGDQRGILLRAGLSF